MLSKNGIAVAVVLIEAFLSAIGVEFEPGSIAKVVEGIAILASLLLLVWNQYEREDVRLFFWKKYED